MRVPKSSRGPIVLVIVLLAAGVASAAEPQSNWVTLPRPRAPGDLGDNVASVTAEVDTKSPGTPISPFIYGASMGDRKAAVEAGLTILRAGGNEVTTLNWKHGFWNKGNDWFFTNYGKETPPERNWLVAFHGENKAAGLSTYLTLPIMGRVAKDGVGVGFDIRKHADQQDWAGKHQPQDRQAFAGNGRQIVRDAGGQPKKDGKGNTVYRDAEANPDDTSVVMPPLDQAQMLRFMMRDMNYGAADKGGVPYLALDNEPGLWHTTHRALHPKGVGYDELWERTLTYGTLLKGIDPTVKLAGPCAWGWTEYFNSGLDSQLIADGKGNWGAPPDYTAHGKVPLGKWYLKKLAEQEKKTGRRLVDIFDFHFYPQTGIFNGGKVNDPKTMELRAQQTRTLWDPTYKDPSWMAQAAPNGVLRLIPMMKEWIAECNPGMQTSIGEYNFGGEKDASGGVAQAEILGIFAREQLDFGFLWLFPSPNTSHWFAFKIFRNPDGKQARFGDRYLPAKVSAPDDVSVHAARDSATGRLTFMLVNKRAAKGAKVTLKLSAPVPAQEVTAYEYGIADGKAIGQLPARNIPAGQTVEVDLPPMSVVRLDIRAAAAAGS